MNSMTYQQAIESATDAWRKHVADIGDQEADWTLAEKNTWIAARAADLRRPALTPTPAARRMGCDACGDDVPVRLTPRGHLCADCRHGKRTA